MKKFFLSALMLVSIVTLSFAKDPKSVNSKVLDAFTAEFASATDVNWSVNAQFTKASFKMNGKNLDAFYNFSGDMVCLTQAVPYESLSQKVQKNIAKKYAGYSIGETVYFQNNDESAYYIAAENDTKKLILKVTNNHVTIFRKKNK
jgi:hypothetical protein